MDLSPKLKWCTLAAIGAVTVGVVCADLSKRRKGTSTRRTTAERAIVEMAATVETDCPAEPVHQLASTLEQLKVAGLHEEPSSSMLRSPAPEERVGEEEASDSFIPDRDSANHSPSDFLSGNLHSDSHSEVRYCNFLLFFLSRAISKSCCIVVVEFNGQWQRRFGLRSRQPRFIPF